MKTLRANYMIALIAAIAMFGCDKTNENPAGLILEINEDITENTLWLSGNTYEISGLIRVEADIIIEPGTTIKFKKDAGLELAYWDDTYATIKAVGTPDKPIIFTSVSNEPAPGDYRGIRLYKGATDCEFSFCVFEYGGSDTYFGTVYLVETNAKFTNNVFRNAKGNAVVLKENAEFREFSGNEFHDIQMHPISIYPYSVHSIGTGNNFNAGAGYGIFLAGTNYEFDTPGSFTWLAHDAPYVIESEIRVGAPGTGVNLSINPGTTLQFQQNGQISIAYWDTHTGKLIAEGTEESPIVFTSNAQNVQKGDWNGLVFYDGSAGSSLSHCHILYAGQNDYHGAFLLYQAGHNTVSFTDSRIAFSNSHAIRVYESSMNHSSVVFEENNGDDYSEL
jgi:hypothetical protein